MNELLTMLSGGDLRSDGRANEVAEQVIRKPKLLGKLAEGLNESNDVVRARIAHALERNSRINPELLRGLLPSLVEIADRDEVPMVKWHIAMILGNMKLTGKELNLATSTLFRLLKDESVFAKAWAISSLTLIGRRNPSRRGKIMNEIRACQRERSIAIRTRVRMALDFLNDKNKPISPSWLKS